MDAVVTAESLPELLNAMLWGILAVSAVGYFVTSYLVEVLAQKHDEPRWMAWIPLVNAYLMLRLIGWGTVFWLLVAGYAIGLGGMFLPAPISMLAALVMLPTALAILVIALVYWPVLARRRGLPLGVGLLMVLPQFAMVPLEFVLPETVLFVISGIVALVAFGAFLWIVFHDGGPEAPPHPVGWVTTALGVLAGAVVVLNLPSWLEQNGALEQWQQQLAQREAESATEPDEAPNALASALRDWFGEAREGAAHAVVSGAIGRDEPAPHVVADVCPEGAREAGARPPAGREWWCEVESPAGWVRHGPSRRWLHARAVEEAGEYRHGVRHGTWTRYWRTGGRRTQADFRDGTQHGWMHRWDEAGRLEERLYFHEGAPGTGPPPEA